VVTVGYHASHEQHPPSALLGWVRQAEAAGFDAAMCSDHFHPWSERQGNSGFAWSWLGAALQATQLPMGVVNAPGQRYHPAIIAQAAATLAEMITDSFCLDVGSGQDLNEHITGDTWPRKADRNQRLLESVEVIRALWDGQTVTHRGAVVVEDAHLYTRPAQPPRLLGAAITPTTASWVADWADGLITIAKPLAELREIVAAFREDGGEGKPMALQVQLSYAPTDAEALAAAHEQWATNIFDSQVLASLRMPADFEAAASFVEPDNLPGPVLVSSDLARHAKTLADYIELGFDEVYLHDLHHDQDRFLADFGDHVLPELR
jgi:coenzyme F420-dependent glucose-6-phosphate dehydrogenase